jgi:hypothetical protein
VALSRQDSAIAATDGVGMFFAWLVFSVMTICSAMMFMISSFWTLRHMDLI